MKRHYEVVNFLDKKFPFSATWDKGFLPYRRPCLNSHREVEIHYITNGSGTYLIGNKFYNAIEGSLLIIHANEIHKLISVKENTLFDKISMIFSPAIVNKHGNFKPDIFKILFKCEPASLHCLHFKNNIMAEIDYVIRSIYKDYGEKGILWKESIVTQLTRLCIITQRCFAEKTEKESKLKKDNNIQKVLEYIDENIMKELYLDSISAHVGLASNYLSSKFKKTIGISISEYIIAKRINEAKKRLESNHEDKIISIALESGFKDLSNFNHTFKKLTGFTPSSYRQIVKS